MLHCFPVALCLQHLQRLLDALIAIGRLWGHGTAADAPKLSAAVGVVFDTLDALHEYIGPDLAPVYPKLHELRHIARDLAYFGPAVTTSSGTQHV